MGIFDVTSYQLAVQLSDNANGYLIADAVQIQFLGNLPTVQVQDGSTPVNSGGSDSFGTTFVGTGVTKTFTVTNHGTQTLTLGAFGNLPTGFVLTQGFGSTSLAPGASTTFQVALTGTAVGSYSGALSFATSDPNFPTYSYTISGTVSGTEVIDDSGPGYSETSGWTNAAGDGGYDNEFNYAAAGIGSHTASWTTSSVPAGTYNVQMTWVAAANRATNATYSIYDGSTLVGTVSVNQQNAPSGGQVVTDGNGNNITFQSLGTFTINSGTLTVVLSNNANGFVIADAMLLSMT
jgi:hypothetical protein